MQLRNPARATQDERLNDSTVKRCPATLASGRCRRWHRIQKVFQGRAEATGVPIEEVEATAMAHQSLKSLVDPKDIAALAVFLASDAAKTISVKASLLTAIGGPSGRY